MAINDTVLPFRHLRDQRSTDLYFIKGWGWVVIDDVQQAEGVDLALHNQQSCNPSSHVCMLAQMMTEWQ